MSNSVSARTKFPIARINSALFAANFLRTLIGRERDIYVGRLRSTAKIAFAFKQDGTAVFSVGDDPESMLPDGLFEADEEGAKHLSEIIAVVEDEFHSDLESGRFHYEVFAGTELATKKDGSPARFLADGDALDFLDSDQNRFESYLWIKPPHLVFGHNPPFAFPFEETGSPI